jgi:hypothetical protein
MMNVSSVMNTSSSKPYALCEPRHVMTCVSYRKCAEMVTSRRTSQTPDDALVLTADGVFACCVYGACVVTMMTVVTLAVLVYCREVVQLLLAHEASTNILDVKGSSPLHLAAWTGNVDVVRLLLCHGPSVPNVNLTVSTMDCAGNARMATRVLSVRHSCEVRVLVTVLLDRNREEKANKHTNKPWPLVRKRTITAERPPLVDEI